MVLPLVLIVSVLAALALIAVMYSAQRRQAVQRNDNEIRKIQLYTKRMENILAAPHLCTCNLKDLEVSDGPNGKSVELTPGGNYRQRFGFYKLTSTSDCAGPDLIDNGDVVLQLSTSKPDSVYINAMAIDRLSIKSFVKDPTYVNPPIERYSAKVNFVSSAQLQRARNNFDSPIGADIFIEVDSSTKKILRCFPPGKNYSPPFPSPSLPTGLICCGPPVGPVPHTGSCADGTATWKPAAACQLGPSQFEMYCDSDGSCGPLPSTASP